MSLPEPAHRPLPALFGKSKGRELRQHTRNVQEAVTMSAVEVDGAVALASHSMRAVKALWAEKSQLVDGDDRLDMLLSHLVGNTVMTIESVQFRLLGRYERQP